MRPKAGPKFLCRRGAVESTLVTNVALGVFGGRDSEMGVTGLTRVMGILRSIVLASNTSVVLAPACRMFSVCGCRRSTVLMSDSIRARAVNIRSR